jgi:hypothetical protein
MEHNGPDLGEPIRILRDVAQDTSPAFLTRIRSRIHRRATASQMLSFSWGLPGTVLVELGRMFGEVVKSVSGSKDRQA